MHTQRARAHTNRASTHLADKQERFVSPEQGVHRAVAEARNTRLSDAF